ncbi:hypothetical protein HY772_07315 [Candidatus Woesearchaeota archaeon]|nr:hypothetical protein [Candidatus Woesearchaeota archaeon]
MNQINPTHQMYPLRTKSRRARNRRARNKLYFIFVIVLLIGIGGCGYIQSSFKKQDTRSLTLENFRRGTDAVSIEFLENSPPPAVFVKDKFNVAFLIKNVGAYDISEGTVTLAGFEQTAWKFQTSPPTQTFTIPGRSQFLSQGGEDIVTFPVESQCFPGYTGSAASAKINYTSNFKAIACFKYQTQADASVCIDPVRSRTTSEKPECTPKPVTFSGGQGGPVGVTTINVGVVPYGKDINVDVTVGIAKLNSKVSIYSSQSPNGCFSADSLNNVEIEVFLSGQAMQCNAKQLELHTSGDSVVKCSKTLPPEQVKGAFVAPVTARLSYRVSQSALKSILVSPPPGQNVDCGKPTPTGVSGTAGATADACSQAYTDYSCKDISTSCPDANIACLQNLGCVKGLCPGAATIVCCP